MANGKVFKVNRLPIFGVAYRLRATALFTGLLLAGLLIGISLYSKQQPVADFSQKLFVRFCADRAAQKFWQVFFDALLLGLFDYAVLFLFGCSMLGIGFVPLWIAANGFCFGALSAYLYQTFSVKGVAFYAVMVVPAAVLFLVGFLSFARDCMRFSFETAKLTMPHAVPNILSGAFRQLLFRLLSDAFPLLAAAVLDGLVSKFFFRFFHLEV